MVSWGPSRAGIKCSVRRAEHLIPGREGPHVNERDGFRSLSMSALPRFFAEEKNTVGFLRFWGAKRVLRVFPFCPVISRQSKLDQPAGPFAFFDGFNVFFFCK